MTHEKLCLCCKHFKIDFGTPDYSDVTPGDPPSYDCGKGLFPSEDNYPANFGYLIQTAKTCKDFKHR
jgi:hypothetical protein